MMNITTTHHKNFILNNKYRTCDEVFKHFNKRKKVRKKKNVQPTIKCGTIILNKDKTKLLLVQNNYFKKEHNIELWGIPKGSRIDNETYADCAIRETYEETGIKLKLKNNMIRVKIRNTYYFVYVMETITNILIPIDKTEIYKVKWFTIADIYEHKINLETKIFIKQKLNFVKNL